MIFCNEQITKFPLFTKLIWINTLPGSKWEMNGTESNQTFKSSWNVIRVGQVYSDITLNELNQVEYRHANDDTFLSF